MGFQTMRKLLTLSAMAAIMAPALMLPAAPAAAKKYQYSEWRGRDGRTYCRKSDGDIRWYPRNDKTFGRGPALVCREKRYVDTCKCDYAQGLWCYLFVHEIRDVG